MIKINIICIGKIKEKYFTDAIAEYAKRLTAFCKFNIIELPEERIKSNIPNRSQIDEVIFSEGKRIMQKFRLRIMLLQCVLRESLCRVRSFQS